MALDTRKFEIELYWKRAAYFWTFIALTFTSFFIVANGSLENLNGAKETFKLIISALGIFLSLCWFLGNKGSKYWQENWEFHVDLLEDDIMGPLYKTTKTSGGLRNAIFPWRSYKFSVGKISIMISAMMIIVWTGIFLMSLTIAELKDPSKHIDVYAIIVILLVGIILLLYNARSTGNNGQKEEKNSFDQRKIENDTTPKTSPMTPKRINNKFFSFVKYLEIIGLTFLLTAFGWQTFEVRVEEAITNEEWTIVNDKLDQMRDAEKVVCETIKCPQYEGSISKLFPSWPRRELFKKGKEQHANLQQIRILLYILGSLLIIIGKFFKINKKS